MGVGLTDLIEIAKRMYSKFQKDDLLDRAKVVAYQFLFSVVPLMIFLTALSAFIGGLFGTEDAITGVTNWLFTHLPSTAAEAVKRPIQDVLLNQSSGLLSVSAIIALWTAKGGVAAMIKGLNVAFDVADRRSWFKRTTIAILLTVALGLSIIINSSILVLGLAADQRIQELLNLGNRGTDIWRYTEWPLIILFLLFALTFLYWAGPDAKLPVVWLTPGAIWAVAGWGIVTYGFGFYFKYAGAYAAAYGVLGGVLAFMFWLYLLSLIVLIGGELNAVLYSMRIERKKTDTAQTIA